MRNQSPKHSYVTLSIAALAGFILSSPVYAEGWYLGADIVNQRTTLDYTAKSETYATQQIRMKLGYIFNEYFALEGRGASSASDTNQHLGGNQFRWQTGLVSSLYVRATLPLDFRFGHIDVNFLYGLSSMDTTYTDTVASTTSSEVVKTFDFGLGAEYKVNQNFYLSLEGRIFSGTANYLAFFPIPDSVNVTGRSLSLGTTFRF